MQHARPWAKRLLLAVVFVSFASVTTADAGVPMIMLAWPAAWLALLPVVLIEAAVAHRILELPTERAVEVSTAANAASTLVGLPLSWALMLLVELLVTSQGRHVFSGPPDTLPQRVLLLLSLLAMAPWLPPIERGEDLWMVPASMMVLTVGFFFASVWVERVVLRRMLPVEAHGMVRKWSWQANILSYAAIEISLLITLLALTWGDNWPF